jgi:hypothetical protein
MIQCILPSTSSAQQCLVRVSNNGQDFEGTSTFAYEGETQRLGLVPSTGPVQGGTVVTVTGLDLGSEEWSCRFGSVPALSALVVVNGTAGYCSTPLASAQNTSEVQFELVSRATGTQASGVFLYVQPVELMTIAPSIGGIQGGTVVELRGAYFHLVGQRVWWGSALVHSESIHVQSSSVISVVTPSVQQSGDVTVRVEASGAGIGYVYVPEALVRSVVPSWGPTLGQMLVTVLGSEFVASPSLMCRAGRASSFRAIWRSSTRVECTTSEHRPGNTTLGVSNYRSERAVWRGVKFEIRPLQSDVRRLVPSTGPVAGGTVVHVLTTGTHVQGSMVCMFGSSLVQAQTLNATAAACTSPRSETVGQVLVKIGATRHQLHAMQENDGAPFEYVHEVGVLGIQPVSGSAHGGGLVHLRGLGFRRSRTFLRFGSTVVGGSAVEVLTSTLLECYMPAGAAGTVDVDASTNGQDFTSGAVQFRYLWPNEVVGLSPSKGPARGGTMLTVFGKQFPLNGKVVCKAGTSRQVSIGIIASASMVECQLPEHMPGNATIELSFNGQDFSRSGQKFVFLKDARIDRLEPSSGPTDGGMLVTVHGAELVDADGLKCLFGDRSGSRVRVESSRTAYCRVPEGSVGVVRVGLWSHEAQRRSLVSNQALFEYVSRGHVHAVWPSIASGVGGTRVTVRGSGFLRATQSACIFGASEHSSPVEVVSDSVITCATPAHTMGSVKLRVGDPRGEAHFGTLGFVFDELPMVYTVSPSQGHVRDAGGMVVTVGGTNLRNTGAGMCRVGRNVSEFRWISSTAVACTIPPTSGSRNMTVELSNDGGRFSSEGVEFHHHRVVTLLAMDPSHGPVAGGTIVSISSGPYRYEGAPRCVFDRQEVTGSAVSSTLITCLSPARMAVGKIPVGLSSGLSDLIVSSLLTFEYTPRVFVEAIVPCRGVLHVSSAVTVLGAGFGEGAHCRFGSRRMSGMVLSSTKLRCTVPARASQAKWVVEVSNEEGSGYSTSGVQFELEGAARITGISPSLGVDRGQETVTVFGVGFLNVGSLACRFGNVSIVRAQWQSSSMVLCISPALIDANLRRIDVEVSNTGKEFSAGGTALYEYRPPLEIHAVQPSTGTVHGGSVVTIRGRGLGSKDRTALHCSFGAAGAVRGRVLSSSMMTCVSPALPPGRHTMKLGSEEWESVRAVFEVLESPAVQRLEPSLGPVHGGTAITVVGVGFGSGSVHCRLGHMVIECFVRGSTSRAVCQTPPMLEGLVPVEASADGVHYSTDSRLFLYYKQPEVLSVRPSGGSAGRPHVVTVVGNAFYDGAAACRAGDERVEAMWLSSSAVACKLPASGSPQNVTIEISSNGVDFTQSSTSFSYTRTTTLLRLQPSFGPVLGGSRIEILGGFWTADAHTGIQFGVQRASMSIVSSSKVVCLAPPATMGTAGAVEVHLSLHSVGFGASEILHYRYTEHPALMYVLPDSGAEKMAHVVTVVGKGLSGAASIVRTQGRASRCYSGTSTAVVCLMPPGAAGTVGIEMSSNGVDFTADGARFEYEQIPAVLRIEPSVSSGVAGEVLTVIGESFASVEGRRC